MYMGNDLCVRKTRVRDRWSNLELDQGSKRGNGGMREPLLNENYKVNMFCRQYF